jgi:hypothetical protein
MAKLVTPEFRGSYVFLTEPRSMPGAEGGKPKYQITVVLPKNHAFWADLDLQVNKAAVDKWGKVPPRLKTPVKDGDDSERSEFAGSNTVQATSLNRPGIVDTNLSPILSADEIYSGAYYRISYHCYAWEHPTGGKGVSLAVDNVMKVKDGEAFSGKSSAESDFAEFGGGSSDSMLD